MDIDSQHQLSILTAAPDLIHATLQHLGAPVQPRAEPRDNARAGTDSWTGIDK